jgi:hypothetical protein
MECYLAEIWVPSEEKKLAHALMWNLYVKYILENREEIWVQKLQPSLRDDMNLEAVEEGIKKVVTRLREILE